MKHIYFCTPSSCGYMFLNEQTDFQKGNTIQKTTGCVIHSGHVFGSEVNVSRIKMSQIKGLHADATNSAWSPAVTIATTVSQATPSNVAMGSLCVSTATSQMVLKPSK